MPHECFADEIAIDFPSVGRVVPRMRAAFLGERADADVLHAAVSLSRDGKLLVATSIPMKKLFDSAPPHRHLFRGCRAEVGVPMR